MLLDMDAMINDDANWTILTSSFSIVCNVATSLKNPHGSAVDKVNARGYVFLTKNKHKSVGSNAALLMPLCYPRPTPDDKEQPTATDLSIDFNDPLMPFIYLFMFRSERPVR